MYYVAKQHAEESQKLTGLERCRTCDVRNHDHVMMQADAFHRYMFNNQSSSQDPDLMNPFILPLLNIWRFSFPGSTQPHTPHPPPTLGSDVFQTTEPMRRRLPRGTPLFRDLPRSAPRLGAKRTFSKRTCQDFDTSLDLVVIYRWELILGQTEGDYCSRRCLFKPWPFILVGDVDVFNLGLLARLM